MKNDVLWEMYQLNTIELIKAQNWAELRNNYWKMTELLMSEHNHETAAYFAVSTVFIDINTQNIDSIEIGGDFVMPVIAPFVAATINAVKKHISHEVLSLAHSTFPLPYKISLELFSRIIESIAKRGNGNISKFKKELHTDFEKQRGLRCQKSQRQT